MRKLILTVFTLLLGAALAGANDFSQHHCGLWTLSGDYGLAISGTRPAPGVTPLMIEQMIGTAIDTFNGDGTFTQTDNIHGSISGYPASAVDRPGSGSYTLNSNCTGTMLLNNEGSPQLTLSIVVVDEGREIRIAVVAPPPVLVTSNARKIH
jgi:hypothetical protein